MREEMKRSVRLRILELIETAPELKDWGPETKGILQGEAVWLVDSYLEYEKDPGNLVDEFIEAINETALQELSPEQTGTLAEKVAAIVAEAFSKPGERPPSLDKL